MPKLLIVEDDADIVENLSVLLEDEGYSVYRYVRCHGARNFWKWTSSFDTTWRYESNTLYKLKSLSG